MLRSAYSNNLYFSFYQIFNDNFDATPDASLFSGNFNRENILYMQFHLQKYGKSFGMSQMRLFKIQNNKLYQVDKKNEQKQLPIPKRTQQQFKINQKYWAQKCKDYSIRLFLQFQDRGQVYIYFHSQEECNEITAYIATMIMKQNKISFHPQVYLNAVRQAFVNKLIASKKNIKRGLSHNQLSFNVLKQFNDQAAVSNILEKWSLKALSSDRIVDTHIIINSMESLNTVTIGQIKIWLNDTVYYKIAFDQNNSCTETLKGMQIRTFIKPQNVLLKTMNCKKQIILEIKSQNKLWRADTFAIQDIRRIAKINSNLAIIMRSKQGSIVLKIQVLIKKENIGEIPQQITPKCYSLINELYSLNNTQFTQDNIHSVHRQLYCAGWNHTLFIYVSFSSIKQLSKLLSIQEPLKQFLSTKMFEVYAKQLAPATLIYTYWLKEGLQHKYYDVERIMWKYGEKYRRLLSALKAFNKTPLINFTDPFYQLILGVDKLVFCQTILNNNQKIFDKSNTGKQSLVFFLVLSIVKAYPGIFVCRQPTHKKALPANSLLFYYILHKQLYNIALKIAKIQLNIQACFGKQFVSLFSRLFHYDNLATLWKMLFQQGKNETLFLHTLIGAFLALMEEIDTYNSSYITAEHYLFCLQQISRKVKPSFFEATQRWAAVSKQMAATLQFQQLLTNMQKYYQQNEKDMSQKAIGEIIEQVYDQFSGYHFKEEIQDRVVKIVFDGLDFAKQSKGKLQVSIFQSQRNPIYNHQFTTTNVTHLHHSNKFQIKNLKQLQVIWKKGLQSYFCRIDPIQFPFNRNYYLLQPLLNCKEQSQDFNYLWLQLFISQEKSIQSLVNPIPSCYIATFFASLLPQRTLTFCDLFMQSFPMRDSNFNLLYSQLGWYGVHYLIPDERLIHIYSSSSTDAYVWTAAYGRCVHGRAIVPNDNQPININLIKNSAAVHYQPNNTVGRADGASRLLFYPLDNFNMGTVMAFHQFYYKMTNELPLFRTLVYSPLQQIRPIILRVSTPNSACLITISCQGVPLRTTFTNEQIKQIQSKSMFGSKLPATYQIKYCYSPMRLDSFLFYLRINLLDVVLKNQSVAKPWPNALVFKTNAIYNYPLNVFYQLMNQMRESALIQFSNIKTMNKQRKYLHFGNIMGLWKSVSLVAKIETKQKKYVAVIQALQHKKMLLNSNDFILTTQQQVKTFQIKEQQLTIAWDIIEQEFNKN